MEIEKNNIVPTENLKKMYSLYLIATLIKEYTGRCKWVKFRGSGYSIGKLFSLAKFFKVLN